ncbi:ABC transporter substrate-binding protein [Brevibacillus sp. NRS-1366]|uniref:ABC transporter substrate-binding protein n=1 Tax=Brevibacillus sp. NRS-1366 TaxID=3233899 RepID=UPI003D1F7AF5
MLKIKRGFRGITFVLLAALLMSLVIGCSQASPAPKPNQPQSEAKPKTGGTITMAFPMEPDTLDAHTSTGADTIATLPMGGSLLTKDPATHEYKPNLAEEYKVSEDGKTLTFKIRSGVTMHDGTPVTAKTFKETFDRILDPKTAAKTSRIFLAAVKSVKAPDDQTLILELERPVAPLLGNISTTVLQPLSMKAIEKYGEQYGRNPVGMGPWKFESWQAGQSITLVPNKDYKGHDQRFEYQGPPRPDKLVIKFIQDPQTMLSALNSGTIDVAWNVPAKDIKKYRNNEKYEVLDVLRTGLGLMVGMNLKNDLFQDIQVRKAINMLVNKEAIVQSVLLGEGVIANGPLSPYMLGYDKGVEEYGYKYNLDEAKKLLDAAGWKINGEGVREKNGNTISLNLLSTVQYNKDAQLIQSMLGEAGIKVSIQNLEPVAQMEAALKGNFDLVMTSYVYTDPDILSGFFHSSLGGYNFAGINDPKLDDLIIKGQSTYDTEARKQIYAEAQKYMVEQAYIVPVYVAKQFTVVNKRVKGVKLVEETPMFNDAWVDQ